jgi:hypothetical protein
MKAISPWQFTVFRMLFGLYLTVHFLQLIPDAAELFSREGMLRNAQLNFTFGLLPNPLEHWDSPAFATLFVLALALLSGAFALGICRRFAALLLWFGWACLFNRNNLISNPALPYIGMLLLLTVLVPAGEPLSLNRKEAKWEFPGGIYWTAWALLAVGYGFSGWTKLQSPSWLDGSALTHLLNNPLARPGLLRETLLRFPEGLRFLTWTTLALELLFLPLSLHPVGRLVAWSAMSLLHIAILFVIAFADLSMGMLMIHLFLFDPTWISRQGVAIRSAKMDALSFVR